MGARPTFKDLLEHVVKEAAHEWRALGLELLPYKRHAVLDIIEANSPHDVVKCCGDLFRNWLDTTVDASWDQLIRALWRVQLYGLALHLEPMIIREAELYSTCR